MEMMMQFVQCSLCKQQREPLIDLDVRLVVLFRKL